MSIAEIQPIYGEEVITKYREAATVTDEHKQFAKHLKSQIRYYGLEYKVPLNYKKLLEAIKEGKSGGYDVSTVLYKIQDCVDSLRGV